MKIKLTAIVLSLLMISGCSKGALENTSSSSSEPEYIPTYTYVNSDPGMVLIEHPDGDITYKDYRLYLDMIEEMARVTARQTMAACAVLEKDMKELGITVDEQEARDIASEQVMMAMYYSPSMIEDMQKVSELLGISADEASECLITGIRPQYLLELMNEHFTGIAAENHPADSGQAGAEEAAEGEVDERQQAIMEEANAMLTEYVGKIHERIDFDDDSSLATENGEAIPYTDEIKRYIDYTAMSARYDSANYVLSGEVVLRELQNSGATLDYDSFLEAYSQNVEQMRADPEITETITELCEKFSATPDDYYKAFERPMWLQQAGSIYYANLNQEYSEKAAADSGSVPASFEEYFSTEFSSKLEKATLVNITGK